MSRHTRFARKVWLKTFGLVLGIVLGFAQIYWRSDFTEKTLQPVSQLDYVQAEMSFGEENHHFIEENLVLFPWENAWVTAQSNTNHYNPGLDPYAKQDKVVNPHPFKVVHSNPDLCKVDNLLFIVYVHSAMDHYKRRAIIRKTWGNITQFPNIRLFFVMGVSDSVPMMQNFIEHEAETYQDILQEDFEDTYGNLTYKAIAALKWISHHCHNAKYVIKTDDDVFVNMYTLQNHFRLLHSAGYDHNLMMCLIWRNVRALRTGKWAVSVKQYPDMVYPPYCAGISYMFSRDIASILYNMSNYVKSFWLDDIYISGILTRRAGIELIPMTKTYLQSYAFEKLFADPREWYKYAFTHIHNEKLFLKMWGKISQLAKVNKIPHPNDIKPGMLANKYKAWGQVGKTWGNAPRDPQNTKDY